MNGFWDFIFGRNRIRGPTDAECRELRMLSDEYNIRKLAFDVCVNFIANAVARCECRTFLDGAETRGREYYLWNVSPNVNQSSSAFWHDVVYRLCSKNEALIITRRWKDGADAVYSADSWTCDEEAVTRQQIYREVRVKDLEFRMAFSEPDVMHLRLNHLDITPVLEGLQRSHGELLSAAKQAYNWNNGRHLKVHVDQLAQGAEGWEESFQRMMTAQVQPFLNSAYAILPEFDGYAYSRMDDSGRTVSDTRDLKALMEDIFEYTARAFQIPAVLVNGKVEATADANRRFLTNVIDPICDQISEEATRKRYTYDEWASGGRMMMDSSALIHFDMFEQAGSIEKLLGSLIYSPNEILTAAGRPRINEPWADEHYITKNIGTIDEVLKEVEKD